MGLLEDLIGGNQPVTPGLLDAAGYMDPAQYDRARRSSAMDGLWAGLLAGGAPSLTPRNFFSALGTGMQGRQQYATDFDKDQLASSQAAAQRALIPQRQLELQQKQDALKLVGEKLPQLIPGVGGGAGGTGAAGGAGGGGKAGSGGGAGGGPGSISPTDHYTFLVDNGASPNEATLLTSAAGAESSFRPDLTHDGGIGYGLYGHNDTRLAGMRSFAGVGEKDPVPWQQQSLYALAELRGQTPGGGEIKAGDMARAATTPEQLTDAQLAFERPKGWNTGGGNREQRLALTTQYFNNAPYRQQAANEIPSVGAPRSLDPAAAPAARPGFDTMFPDPSGRAASLGGPVPAAIAAGVPPAAPAPAVLSPAAARAALNQPATGQPPITVPPPGAAPAPAPGLTVLGAPADRAYQLNAMTPQQQHEANLAAGGRGIFPPGQKFNRNGSPISGNLTATMPGQQSGANIPPEVARSLGTPRLYDQRADLGAPPDTVVPTGPTAQIPGLNGAPAAGGPAALQLAALVSGGSGGRLPTGPAPATDADTVVPPGPLPAAPATPAPAPAATQPPAGTLVPGAMPAMPAPAEQAIVPRPDLAPQPGIPERPTLTPAPPARSLPAMPPPPSLTAPDFSQVGQAVPADVARRAGIALQVGLGLKILGLDVPAISKIAELPLELQKTAYEAAVKAPYELRNTQYQSLLNMTTEQFKNLNENDRTLWSAALGMDKTEFEARIRQGEKNVEEQNKQINQNWANMTDAEKAKAAASNQFALAKYNAELTTAGEWNKPIQVTETEPGTLRERTYTSSPAAELQKEIARRGGAPTGLTVGQALGAPTAPGAPATPAPAPGAVQPGMTPGSRFSKAGPGEQAAATGLANVYVDKTKEVSAQADAAKKGLTSVDILLNAPPIDWQGKLAGPKQEFNRVMTSLFGVNTESVRSYEQASQLMGDTMRTALRASDPNPTDRQQQSLASTLPSPERSREGYEVGLRYMAGMQDWQVYRNQQLNAHLRVNPNDPQGYFQKEDISGIPFIVARMRPQDRADYMTKVGRTDPAALTRLLNQLEQIKGASGGAP